MGLSRVEDILQAGLDGTTMPKPLSRVEILLEEWIEAAGGSSSDAYATAISLTIDSSTYVMTAQLLNKDGDPLGTAQTIDLPLESMVVSGSYNAQTKKVILTLKNGQTVEFSIADLVDGLASQSDLDALTTRVGVNENNILLLEEMNGAKNYINYTLATLKTLNTSGTWADNVYTLNNVTFTVNNDLTITVNGTPSATTNFELCTTIKSGGTDMIISAEVYNDYYLLALQRTGSPQYVVCNTGAKEFSDSSSVQRVYIQVRIGEGATPPTNARFKPMITDKTVYNAGFTDYQPYALSNAELTAKEQANENNILTLQQQVGYANTELEGVL